MFDLSSLNINYFLNEIVKILNQELVQDKKIMRSNRHPKRCIIAL